MPTCTMLLSSQKLRSLICSRNITHEQLAENIGCSDRQIRNWISKDTDIHVSSLYMLASELEVNMNDLLIAYPLHKVK